MAIESNNKHAKIFHIPFFPPHTLTCQGQCLQNLSPNSQWFRRYHIVKQSTFMAGPDRIPADSQEYLPLMVVSDDPLLVTTTALNVQETAGLHAW